MTVIATHSWIKKYFFSNTFFLSVEDIRKSWLLRVVIRSESKIASDFIESRVHSVGGMSKEICEAAFAVRKTFASDETRYRASAKNSWRNLRCSTQMPNSPSPYFTLFSPPFHHLSFFLYYNRRTRSIRSVSFLYLSLCSLFDLFLYIFLCWIFYSSSLCFSCSVWLYLFPLLLHFYPSSAFSFSLFLFFSLLLSFLSHAHIHVHISSYFVALLVQRLDGQSRTS